MLLFFFFVLFVRDALEDRLRDKKDMYTDLALSDALARELRRVPEEDQTIKVRCGCPTDRSSRRPI